MKSNGSLKEFSLKKNANSFNDPGEMQYVADSPCIL